MNRPISRLKTNLLLWFAVAVPLLLSGPLSMFTSNYGDFDLGAQQLAWTLLPAFWIVLGLAAATALLPWQHAVQLTLTWIALSLYVQGNFLVWDYGRFDGTEIPWQEYGYRGIVDCGVWFALLGMVVFFRRAILKDATLILGGLSLLQIGTSVAGFARSSAPMEMKVSVDSGDSLYSFSKDRNVLFLLLDEFSSRGFYQLLKADPDVKREFADFTFYRDIISAFPTTYAAVPAILTGRPAPRSGSMQAYFEAAAPFAINEQLGESGWSSTAVTLHPICKSFTKSPCQSLTQATSVDREAAALRESYKLLDLTFFRYAPHYAKRAIHNNDRWFLQNMDRAPSTPPAPAESNGKKPVVQFSLVPFQENSIDFLSDFAKNINASASQPSFKLLHILIPHGPYTMNQHCQGYSGPRISAPNRFLNNARCGLNLTAALLSKMKTLSVYDATTIVIVADHGTPVGFDFEEFGPPMEKKLRRAFPLLLIKPAHYRASPNEELKIDQRPLSQLDILSLVSELANLNLRIPPSEARDSAGDRVFQHYPWSNMDWSADTLPPIQTYKVAGDSWRLENWHPVDVAPR